VYIKVKDNIIKDIKFETFGCVAAIATSSVLTDLAKKKTIEDALKITRQDVIDALGELPPIKIHCSVLAIDALTQAVYDYYIKNNLPISKELEDRHNQIIKRKSCHL
jgi:nitrogen fixation NifU-like protein